MAANLNRYLKLIRAASHSAEQAKLYGETGRHDRQAALHRKRSDRAQALADREFNRAGA